MRLLADLHISPQIDWVIESFEKGLTKEFETLRIYSLSKSPNNLHLWKKYAAKHTGYCLEFRNAGEFKDAKEVRYRDHFEVDVTGPAQLLGAFYYYKTLDWRKEEELRIAGVALATERLPSIRLC